MLRYLSREIVKKDKLADCSEGLFQKLLHDTEDPFPQPVQLSPRRVGWPEDEVDQWLERRRARRDDEQRRLADIRARMPKCLRETA